MPTTTSFRRAQNTAQPISSKKQTATLQKPVSRVNQNSKQKQDDPIGSVTVTAGALNVRNGAGSNFSRIGELSKGKKVQYFEEKDGWLRILYGTQEGWISAKYTDYSGSTPETENGLFDVTIDVKNYLNIRSGPGTGYDALGKFYGGEKITVLEEKDGWYRFNYDGKEAWVSAEYTKKINTGEPITDEPGPQTGGSPGDIAAAEAQRLMDYYIAHNYKYDQSKRKTEGYYDCSSFTHRCWKAAGLDLQWATAANQAKRIANAGGEISSVNDIQPGDLLFWSYKDNGRYRNISHVAIAIDKTYKIDAGHTPVYKDKIKNPLMIGRPTVLL